MHKREAFGRLILIEKTGKMIKLFMKSGVGCNAQLKLRIF